MAQVDIGLNVYRLQTYLYKNINKAYGGHFICCSIL
jgi:hypothetical protein